MGTTLVLVLHHESNHVGRQYWSSDDRVCGGVFTAEKLNLHSRTNIEIIRCFLPVDFVTTEVGGHTRVEVKM